MKVLAKMEDIHTFTMETDIDDDDDGGIPVPSLLSPLNSQDVTEAPNRAREIQYAEDDEETVKTEVTEESDLDEEEEDRILPSLNVKAAETMLEQKTESQSAKNAAVDIANQTRDNTANRNVLDSSNVNSPVNTASERDRKGSDATTVYDATPEKGNKETRSDILGSDSSAYIEILGSSSRRPRELPQLDTRSDVAGKANARENERGFMGGGLATKERSHATKDTRGMNPPADLYENGEGHTQNPDKIKTAETVKPASQTAPTETNKTKPPLQRESPNNVVPFETQSLKSIEKRNVNPNGLIKKTTQRNDMTLVKGKRETPSMSKKDVNETADVSSRRTRRRRRVLERYDPLVEAAKPQLKSRHHEDCAKHEKSWTETSRIVEPKNGLREQPPQKKSIRVGRLNATGHLGSRRNGEFVPYKDGDTLHIGTRVKTRWSSGNRIYNAVVLNRNDDGTFELRYNDGGHWKYVPPSYIYARFVDAKQTKEPKRADVIHVKSESKEKDEMEAKSDSSNKKAHNKKKTKKYAERFDHGFRGLTWSEQKRKWIARLYHDNSTKHLGTFTDAEEAARVYDAEARKYGKKLNYPRKDSKTPKSEMETSEDPLEIIQKRSGSKPKRKNLTVKTEERPEKKDLKSLISPVSDDSIMTFVEKKQEDYNIHRVFTSRKRKRRNLYDPTIEASKPQWMHQRKSPRSEGRKRIPSGKTSSSKSKRSLKRRSQK